jgi:hypothetical protein
MPHTLRAAISVALDRVVAGQDPDDDLRALLLAIARYLLNKAAGKSKGVVRVSMACKLARVVLESPPPKSTDPLVPGAHHALSLVDLLADRLFSEDEARLVAVVAARPLKGNAIVGRCPGMARSKVLGMLSQLHDRGVFAHGPDGYSLSDRRLAGLAEARVARSQAVLNGRAEKQAEAPG